MSGTTATSWVDASSLVLGVVIEVDDEIIEDACCLQRDDSFHINMAGMDATLKRLDLGIIWGMTHVPHETPSLFTAGSLTL